MIRLLALLVALASCSSRTEPPSAPAPPLADGAHDAVRDTVEGDRMAGTVLSVDQGPMAFDGDALIEIETDHGQRRTVHVAARMNLCRAEGLSLVSELEPGDRIRVVGETVEDGIRPCTGAGHLLARAEIETETVRGLVYTGFETSAFRPCDAPDEAWWLTPSASVADRMSELYRSASTGNEGRGLRVVYEATLTGEIRRGDTYGHLGQYVAEFDAREVVAMEVLAVNPETAVDCPAP